MLDKLPPLDLNLSIEDTLKLSTYAMQAKKTSQEHLAEMVSDLLQQLLVQKSVNKQLMQALATDGAPTQNELHEILYEFERFSNDWDDEAYGHLYLRLYDDGSGAVGIDDETVSDDERGDLFIFLDVYEFRFEASHYQEFRKNP